MDFLPQLASALQELLDSGFTMPLRMVSLSINGAMIYCRYAAAESGVEFEFLAEHMPESECGMMLPINSMVVDATGKNAHVVLDTPDSYRIVH